MLTDEQASSWKKAMNSIQPDGRKEMLTDKQASSWQKAIGSGVGASDIAIPKQLNFNP